VTPVRLLRTNAFRIAALYLALFAASMLALLAFIYVSTADFIERQTEETVDQEISALREEFQRGELPLLRHAIAQRQVALLEVAQSEPALLRRECDRHGQWASAAIVASTAPRTTSATNTHRPARRRYCAPRSGRNSRPSTCC
jgi:Na+-translocating ferredoxin:NAD+ oxidoreductase RnfG subunit